MSTAASLIGICLAMAGLTIVVALTLVRPSNQSPGRRDRGSVDKKRSEGLPGNSHDLHTNQAYP